MSLAHYLSNCFNPCAYDCASRRLAEARDLVNRIINSLRDFKEKNTWGAVYRDLSNLRASPHRVSLILLL